jgi:hypothetical protein
LLAGCGGKSQQQKLDEEACSVAKYERASAIFANDMTLYDKAIREMAEYC